MKHPVIHFEIGGRDVERSARFYDELFGWKSVEGAIDTGTGEGIRGHLNALGHEPLNYVTVYVEVEDIEESLTRVEELGGKRVIGPIEIPNGWFAWFQDLDGNTLGMMRRRRLEPRFATVFPVSLPGDDPTVMKYVKNLSRKGAFIKTNKSPPVGSLITVMLRLPDGGEPIETGARVVRVVTQEQAKESGALEGVGVRFETPSPKLQARLDALIGSIEARAGKLAIVADDDVLVRTMISELLEAQGIRVVQASDGQGVLDLVDKHLSQLTLIVMDLVMPGLDGLSVISELKPRLDPRRVPVVVLTGGGPTAAHAAIDRGAPHAILKGATADDILVAIEGVMAGA